MAARILVIDDNRTNLDLMLYLLRAFGYEAEGRSDGLAGLRAASENAYDAILVDILMPGIDGLEFARRFKEKGTSAVPLIAVTALAMVGDRERILAGGFDGYVAKPIDPKTFVSQIEAHIPAGRRAAVQPAQTQAAPSPPREATGPIVLAVDDVAENVALLHAAMEPFGYRILDARSVEEAMTLLGHARPAVIVCDLHMPRHNGFTFVEKIRSNEATKDIPLLLVSATSWNAADRRRAAELGVPTLLVRPLEPEWLRAEIERLIGA